MVEPKAIKSKGRVAVDCFAQGVFTFFIGLILHGLVKGVAWLGWAYTSLFNRNKPVVSLVTFAICLCTASAIIKFADIKDANKKPV